MTTNPVLILFMSHFEVNQQRQIFFFFLFSRGEEQDEEQRQERGEAGRLYSLW